MMDHDECAEPIVASALSGGRVSGPLVAVKDNIMVRGLPTRAGSGALSGQECTRDAACVSSVRAAGYTIAGKSHMDEFGLGATGTNSNVGWLANPHDASRVCGGSSSGSAVAVAKGDAVAGIGTDTGGSVRIPASFCGVVGIRPQRGFISGAGVLPLAPSLDTVGVLSETVNAGWEMLSVLSMVPRRAEYDVGGLSVAVVNWADTVEFSVGERFEGVIQRLSAAMSFTALTLPCVERVNRGFSRVSLVEAHALYYEYLEALGIQGLTRELLASGANVSNGEYEDGLCVMRKFQVRLAEHFRRYDVLMLPTTESVAPRKEDMSGGGVLRVGGLCRPFSLPGVVSVSVPMPCEDDEMPVGVQILTNDIVKALSVAHYVERQG